MNKVVLGWVMVLPLGLLRLDVSAQHLEVADESGLVSVRWKTIPGVAYKLQSSSNLSSGWTDVDGGMWSYGLGQWISYAVHTYEQGGGSEPSVADPPDSSTVFAVSRYTTPGKILVSWQEDGGGQRLIDSSVLPPNMPAVMSARMTDIDGNVCELTFVNITVPWQDAFLTDPALQEGNPPHPQLLKLTLAYSDIQNAIGTNGADAQNSSSEQEGEHYFYRLQSYHPDSDADGMTDSVELSLSLNAYHPDGDRDGVLDTVEVALGTDPTDPSSTPTMTTTGADAYLQEVFIKLINGSSNLTICAERGGRVWNVSQHSGPSTFTTTLSRGILYRFKLGATGSATAEIDLQPRPSPPATWNWWVETGDGEALGNTSSPTGDHPIAKTLYPVEILILELDDEGQPTDRWLATDNLKVAKWEHSYAGAGQTTTVKPDFNEWDIDQFVVRVPMPWKAGQAGVTIKLKTTSDAENEVVVTEVEEGIFMTEPQLLVSSSVDDLYPAGKDETTEDVTHKVKLGDTVTAIIPLPDGSEGEVSADVPHRAELDFNVWRLDVAGVRSLANVNEAVEWIKEVYAQVGLKINVAVAERPWPVFDPDTLGVGELDIWDRDPDGTRHNFMPSYLAFMNTFPDHGATAVDLFFMKQAESPDFGISVLFSDYKLNDDPVSSRYLNHAFTSDGVGTNIVTPAHELLHVLTDADGNGHHPESFNVLATLGSAGWTFNPDDVRGRRRISRSQEEKIYQLPAVQHVE